MLLSLLEKSLSGFLGLELEEAIMKKPGFQNTIDKRVLHGVKKDTALQLLFFSTWEMSIRP